MIEMIAHRGYWKDKREQNTMESFIKCFEKKYGIETDIRDFNGKVIISHDPYVGTSPIDFEDVLKNYVKNNSQVTLALNVKTDGISLLVKELLSKYSIKNYFVFDASVPELLRYRSSDLIYYSRHSEYEEAPNLYDKAAGIWLDQFKEMWFQESTISGHIKAGKKVCVVSSELHKRDHKTCWELMSHFKDNSEVSLCTDFPDQAKEVLYG
jgi:glycerophosphoryl diester phosphodiesterase